VPQATGIHLGRKRIVAVALRGSSKSSRVVGVGSCPRPEDPAALGPTIRALCAERGLPRDPTVVALPNDVALMRTLALPFTTPEQIRRVLKGEAEAALAGLSVEELALGSHFLGASENEGRVMAVAVRKDALAPMLAGLAASGIDPLAVDLEGFALANALTARGHAPEQGTLVAVECEPDEARFLVLHDRRVRVVRSVPLPLVEPAPPPEDGVPAPAATCAPAALPELSAELTRTLLAGGLMDPPQRALLLGPLAQDPALAAAVERVVGVRAEAVDLLAEVGAPGPDGASAATAYGAALKGLGLDHHEVNLRVDELAFKRRFDQVAGALATFVTLAFIVLLVVLVDVRSRATALRRSWTTNVLAPTLQRFVDVQTRVEPDAEKRAALDHKLRNLTPREELVDALVDHLRGRKQKLLGGPALDTFKMRSALDTWRDWSDRLEAARAGFTPPIKYWVLDSIEVELRPAPSTGTITCAGWLELESGRAFLEAMRNSLATVPDFAKSVPGVTQTAKGPDGADRLQFSLATELPPEQADRRKEGSNG
jgi:hypothetical protein